MPRAKIERSNDRRVGDYTIYDTKATTLDSDEYVAQTLLAFHRKDCPEGTVVSGPFKIVRNSPTEYVLFRDDSEVSTHDRLNGAKAAAAKIVMDEHQD